MTNEEKIIKVKGEIVQNYRGKRKLYVKAEVSDKDFKFGEKVIVNIIKL